MAQEKLNVGDLVVLSTGEREGISGIVSRPATEGSKGHALVHLDEYILGLDFSVDDVRIADESSEGFAQLAYSLIKLGSHVIEQRLIQG